jgi:pimeloyl-ACP methyl ester carboxylesterase
MHAYQAGPTAGIAASDAAATRRALTGQNAPSTPFIETADGSLLFHKDWGTGKPVLLLHSWGVDGDMWQYQMVDLVDRGFRCIAYDRRGHGRSSQPGEGYDFDTLADDLATVIERLDFSDLALVGHSMSCGEIVRYLTRHGSSRIARVALVGPTLPFMMKTPDNPLGRDKEILDALCACWRRDLPQWVNDNEAPFFVPETSPGMRQWLVGLIQRCSLKAAIECQRTAFGTDFRPELPGITLPTLMLHGDKDASVPLGLARVAAALIPNCELKVYAGAPHGLFLTHMGRFNADLSAFLQG